MKEKINIKIGEKQILKIGDKVGNLIWGFDYKIIEISNGSYNIKIQNLKTKEIIHTNSKNIYKKQP